MMTFSSRDLAQFFSTKSRAGMRAEDALKELERRRITGALTTRLSSARSVCDHIAQRAGHRLSELTAHELGALMSEKGWGRHR